MKTLTNTNSYEYKHFLWVGFQDAWAEISMTWSANPNRFLEATIRFRSDPSTDGIHEIPKNWVII